MALEISLEDIKTYFPNHILQKESISYNKESKKFDARESTYFLDLELHSKPVQLPSKEKFKELILDLLKTEGLQLLNWSKKATSLKDRAYFAYKHGFNEFKGFDDDSLIISMDVWLEPYLQNVTTVKELEALDVYSMILGMISWEDQQLLDTLVPSSFKVPSGSNIRIDYSNIDVATISVKIQEVFGLHETPKILNNTHALQIHLLSPAMRPIQITYDLVSFWESSYSEVRKELRGKYKKHYWPEDPYQAVATTKTKKFM